MWMSEARASSAWVMSRFTRRMTGASRGEVLQVLDVAEVLLLVARLDVVDDLAHRRLAAAVEALERRVDLVGRRRCRRARACPRPSARRRSRRNRSDRRSQGPAPRRPRAAARACDIAQELAPTGALPSAAARGSPRRGERQVELHRRGRRPGRAPETMPRRSRITPIFSREPPSCSLQGALEVGGIELAALDEDFAEAADGKRRLLRKHLKSIASRAVFPGNSSGIAAWGLRGCRSSGGKVGAVLALRVRRNPSTIRTTSWSALALRPTQDAPQRQDLSCNSRFSQ